ncbi:MAG: biopolymer transporter ExbD [Stagnimonas sp.]|nr:biopolymer transporter ExbD [Stagnimonas sp.]
MAEINVVPMVDIMLVLLVIFIITAPLLSHAVKIDLPKASSTPNALQADNIQFAIDAAGLMYWNGEALAMPQVIQRMAAAGQKQPTPELHLRIDRDARYQQIAEVMSEAGKAGLGKVGFVTDPSGAPVTTVLPQP